MKERSASTVCCFPYTRAGILNLTKNSEPDLPKQEIQNPVKPNDESDMTSDSVSRAVNNARNERNIPEATNEVNYPELNEITLSS